SAVNQDGPSGGLTVPNGPAQEAVIRRALQFAQVTPDEISYLEAHGTGTQLGDPIELGALHAVFGTSRSTPLPIGSVKTNIGHLEAAAGIAALIKVALMHEHATIAPHLHFQTPNPRAAWPEQSVRVATRLEPWTAATGKRIAGVSSFGFSGTNAHIVVEQPPTPQPANETKPLQHDQPYVLTLSAKSKPALEALCREQATWLRTTPNAKLGDASYTLATGRARFNERAAIVADNVAQAIERLEQLASGQSTSHTARSRVRNGAPPRIAFLFPADETDATAKLTELCAAYPAAKATAEACATAIRATGDSPDSPRAALFTLQTALAQLWRSWGVEPNVCVGQGVGHALAEFVRGDVTLDEAWRRAQTATTAADVAIDLNQLVEQGYRIFIECSATGALVEQGQRLFPAETHFWLVSLQAGQGVARALADAQAKLFTTGVNFAIERTHDSAARRKLRLPTYRFQRRNFFVPPLESQTAILPWTAIHPLLKTRYTHADGAIVFRSELPTERAAYLDDHRIASMAFLPASAYVEMALAAGGEALREQGGGHVTLRDFQFLKALPLRRDQPVTVQLTLQPTDKQAWSFELCSLPQVDQPASAVRHAIGKLEVPQTVEASKPQIIASRDTMTPLTSDELYAKFEGRGLNYGPAFRASRQAWVGDRAVSCDVALSAEQAATAEHYGLHPVLLDACLQSLAAVESFSQRDRFYLPVAIERVRTFGTIGSRVSAHGKIRPATGDGSVVTADFELVSPDGRLLAALDGVQLQALNIESALSTFVALPGSDAGADVDLPPTAEETEMRAELSRVTPAERRELLIGYLQQRLLRVLRRDPTESLDPEMNLFQLGVDSLMSVEFVYDINRGLGVRLPADTLLSYSTIASLADALPAKMSVVEQSASGAIATK
ncbi:MAG: polyketide synthase dehydratase domain-containing protein, partial [Planctomycetaceae bacterium]|nr:polyketide synthase dehydratase domain-containing protein [Planctomycetaceae bacterium]